MPSKKFKKISVPEELYEVFIQFIDLSQAAFTDEDLANMTEVEKKLFSFIEHFLGEDRIYRYKTEKDLEEARNAFAVALRP